MRGEREYGGGGNAFFYRYCPECKAKYHVMAAACHICGKKAEDLIYESRADEDFIYTIKVCRPEKCVQCGAALAGNACRPAFCFGTGKGQCETCMKTDPARHRCCKDAVIREGVVSREDIKKLAESLERLEREKSAVPGGQASVKNGTMAQRGGV
jgi:hypothetical protein